jgi:hypothetical protein
MCTDFTFSWLMSTTFFKCRRGSFRTWLFWVLEVQFYNLSLDNMCFWDRKVILLWFKTCQIWELQTWSSLILVKIGIMRVLDQKRHSLFWSRYPVGDSQKNYRIADFSFSNNKIALRILQYNLICIAIIFVCV